MIAFSILRASIRAIISRGANTSFASLKQIEAGALNVGYAETGQTNGPRYFFCTAGLTTYIVMSMWRRCWFGGLSCDRLLFARLSHDALSFQRHASERSAVGYRRRLVWADLPASPSWVERPQARSQQAGRRHHQGIGCNSRPAVPPTNQNNCTANTRNCTANTRNSHPSAERTSFVALHSKHHL